MINLHKQHKKGFTRTPRFGVSSQSERGFTLFIAIITTSILLMVSFVVANIVLKQINSIYIAQQSQYAFYAAESGVECAMYWDLKNTTGVSAFDPTIPVSPATRSVIYCNGIDQTVGGLGTDYATSTFTIDPLSSGCVEVSVGKYQTLTVIESRGYNTCVSGSRRFERAFTVTY